MSTYASPFRNGKSGDKPLGLYTAQLEAERTRSTKRPSSPSPQKKTDRTTIVCIEHVVSERFIFQDVQEAVGSNIDLIPIRLPTHFDPYQQLNSMKAIVEYLAEKVDVIADEPFAILGIAMGGLYAFELAHHLESTGLTPTGVMLIGATSPSAYLARTATQANPQESLLKDDEVALYILPNGLETPLAADDAIRVHEALPCLERDHEVIKNYQFSHEKKLFTQLHVIPSLNGSETNTRSWSSSAHRNIIDTGEMIDPTSLLSNTSTLSNCLRSSPLTQSHRDQESHPAN